MNFTEKILLGMSCLQLQWQMLLKSNKTCKLLALKILVRIWVVPVFLPPASANTGHQLGTKPKYRATCAASM